MRSLAVLSVFILSLSGASAQSGGSVGILDSNVDPTEMTIDPSKHVRRGDADPPGQPVEVHVAGTIDCIVGAAPPIPLKLFPRPGPNFTVTSDGESFRFAYLTPSHINLQWTADAANPGRWIIDETSTFTVRAEGAIAHDQERDIEWVGQEVEQGTNNCNPQGYVTEVRALSTLHLIMPSFAGTDTETTPVDDDKTTPFPLVLALVGLLGVVAMRRRQ